MIIYFEGIRDMFRINLRGKEYLFYQRELWRKNLGNKGEMRSFQGRRKHEFPTRRPSILGCLPLKPGSLCLIWDHLHQGSVNDSLAQCKRRRGHSFYSRYSAYPKSYRVSRINLMLVFRMIFQESSFSTGPVYFVLSLTSS